MNEYKAWAVMTIIATQIVTMNYAYSKGYGAKPRFG
jgi:hypothetical protein